METYKADCSTLACCSWNLKRLKIPLARSGREPSRTHTNTHPEPRDDEDLYILPFVSPTYGFAEIRTPKAGPMRMTGKLFKIAVAYAPQGGGPQTTT